MLVDEQFLHAEEAVGAMARLRRAHVEYAPFGHVDIIGLIGEGDAIFDVGRLERRRTLDQRRAGDEGLREDEAAILAEHVEAARPIGRLNDDGNRKGARFEHRVGHRSEARGAGKEGVSTSRYRWLTVT